MFYHYGMSFSGCQAARMDKVDHIDVLGLGGKKYDQKELKKAYKVKSLLWHPDK